jgi:hypothetical protein
VSATALDPAVTSSEQPDPAPPRTHPLSRRLAVVGLVVGAVGNTTETVVGRWTLPDPADAPGRLIHQYAEHGSTIGVLSTIGTLAIPFMVIGFLAYAHLLARRMPRTAVTAAVLLVAGMWGFAGVHLAEFAYHSAADVGNTADMRAFVDTSADNVYMGLLWGLPFLAGCVLGVITLSVGLLRSGVLPRWIPAALLGFILLDFSVGRAVPVDPHWLYLVACLGTAWQVGRMSDHEWANA